MTASNAYEEIEGLSTEEERGSPSIRDEISEDELEMWEPQQQEAAPLEEREESPTPGKARAAGDRYLPGPSSSVEFSLQPAVRQSVLLTRKEAMLQQARK